MIAQRIIVTQAACGSSGASNAISPDLSDPQVRAKNLQAGETFRAYYQAVIQTLADAADWPVPNIPVGGFLANAVQSVGPALPSLVTALAPLVAGTCCKESFSLRYPPECGGAREFGKDFA